MVVGLLRHPSITNLNSDILRVKLILKILMSAFKSACGFQVLSIDIQSFRSVLVCKWRCLCASICIQFAFYPQFLHWAKRQRKIEPLSAQGIWYFANFSYSDKVNKMLLRRPLVTDKRRQSADVFDEIISSHWQVTDLKNLKSSHGLWID